jgi:hypothetical protein
MKKRHLSLAAAVFVFIGAAVPLFCAEVSKKQDIAIFGLTARTFDIPTDVLQYIDSSMNNVFVNLKRFNVLGYGDYRIEAEDAEEFIARIREARAQKAAEAGTYDEKFGTIVIKGEDFDRIANSFLLVMPSLSSYNVGSHREEVQSGDVVYFKRVYTAEVVVDITFINVSEGKQEEAIRVTGTGSDTSVDRAGRLAVDSAISTLAPKVRQTEVFKIKSGVILVRGDTITFELGKEMGVKPGDEFEVMTRQEIGNTGRIVELPTGLVKVKKIYPETSEGRIVYQKERITEGDQLVEVAKAGVQVSFNAGVMKVDIPDMRYDITVIDDADVIAPPPSYTDTFFISLDQEEVGLSPVVSLTVEKSLGYRFKGIFEGTALLNFPLFGGIGELGAGAVFQQRRFSFDLSVLGGFLYMTTFQQVIIMTGNHYSMSIEGTSIDFDDEPIMNIYGMSVGVKGSAGFNFLIKPGFALNLGAAYRLYTPIRNWTIRIVETAGSDKESVNLASDSPNIVESETSGSMKQVNISGYEFTLAFTVRF